MKYIKTFESHLSYDEVDLDSFTSRRLVGRWFESEEEATEYLEFNLSDDGLNRSMGDFKIIDKGGNTLKSFQIHPNPSGVELNRNLASKLINKHAYVSSFYPIYAYLEYKHIDKIKELGVKYEFKPLKDLSLVDVLNDYIRGLKIEGTEFSRVYKNPDGHYSGHSTILKTYFSTKKTNDEIKEFRSLIEKSLNVFNGRVGSDYYIDGISKSPDSDTRLRKYVKSLDEIPSEYNNGEFLDADDKFEQISLLLERGTDEDEFVAVIEMESPDKPVMK